jgi:hypothetical protein
VQGAARQGLGRSFGSPLFHAICPLLEKHPMHNYEKKLLQMQAEGKIPMEKGKAFSARCEAR